MAISRRTLKTRFLKVQGLAITPERDSFREHFKHPECCDKGFEQKMISSTTITNGKIVGSGVLFPRSYVEDDIIEF